MNWKHAFPTHLFVLAVVAGLVGHALAGDDDVARLLDGVKEIAAPGVPGPLCVFGKQAFPVAVGGGGGALRQPVVAAARLGKGRVVAFGHTGYFDAMATADTGRLVLNVVRWAAGKVGEGDAKPRVAVRRQGRLAAFLKQQGLNAVALDGGDWRGKLQGHDVLCIYPTILSAEDDYAAITRFVREGGGLVAVDLGWGWLQLNRGKTLTGHHQGNRLLAPAGIVWADGYQKRTGKHGFVTGERPSPLTHAGRAIDALLAHEAGTAKLKRTDVSQAVWVVSQAARALPPADTLLLPRLRQLAKDRAAAVVPTPKKPLTMKTPLARVLLTMQLQRMRGLPPEQVTAHPAAAAFPGAVPADAERVTRSVTIDTTVPAWHSTGLYAAPGEVVAVSVPDAAAGKRLGVRIGAHRDSIWGHRSWRRCPEICRRFPITQPLVRVANAFGGPIYIEVPGGCKLGTLNVHISGGVDAPHYVLGKTDLKQWREAIRHRPAPWAELAGTRVVLTLPSSVVRGLDDPEDLMKFWDQVLDACADLATIPRERARPERYVCDTQISAGYMHSGYPIMTMMDMPRVMVDKARMMRNAHGGVWGLFHEMGHNHQSGLWTFGGTVEVTVNLFTMYVLETVCGIDQGHGAIAPKARERKLKAYLGAPDFAKWTRDPFLALLMYVQLQEAFGWDAYKKVFAEYRALPKGQRPKTDAEKRDQWMVRFSRAVGKNLGPFFQAWAVPTSAQARASITNLPPWLPEGFPPK